MRTTTKLVTTLLASALAACMAGDAPPDDPGDDTGGDDEPMDGTGPAGFITAFAASECMQAHACKADWPTDAGITFAEIYGATLTECDSLALDYYQPDAVRDAVQNGTIDYDRTAADACLMDLDWGTCEQFFYGESPLPAECGQALVGTVDDGGSCDLDLECENVMSWCGDGGTCELIPDA
jgi:hypothetical protein